MGRWGNKVKRLSSPCKCPLECQASGRGMCCFPSSQSVLHRWAAQVISLSWAMMYVYNNKKGSNSQKQIQCTLKINPSWLHTYIKSTKSINIYISLNSGAESESEAAQLCPSRRPHRLWLPGFLVHGIFQARGPEWVAIFFSKFWD